MKCNNNIIYFGIALACIALYAFWPSKDHFQHHYTQSTIAFKGNQYKSVVDSCNKALELNNNHPHEYDVYLNKAKALSKMGFFQEALEAADKAIALEPCSEEAYVAKIYPLYQLQQEEELTAILEEIIAIDPDTPYKGLLNCLRVDRGKVKY
jgi:tetratricopeptide (TPR) repeat protein